MKSFTLRQQARLTGIAYMIFAASAIYGYMYVMKQINVPGNVISTANNIVRNETLYRSSIATGVLTNILFLVVVLMLYHLLRHSGVQLARMMAGLVLMGIPAVLVAVATKITALYILKGQVMTSFSSLQMQELATAFIRLGNFTSQIATILWGLWLFPLGVLVYRCGFIPWIFGVLLIINGIGYVVGGIAFIVLPDYHSVIMKAMYPTYFIGEIPFMFWLVIKGTKGRSVSRNRKQETGNRKRKTGNGRLDLKHVLI